MTLSASPGARRYARQRWGVLADRLRTIRPEAIARAAIGLTLVGVVVTLAVASWPALAPFVLGAVLAYAVLPVANRLDRFMPRVLAAVIAELMAVALLLGVVVVVVPPLLNGLITLAGRLPAPAEIQTWVLALQDQVGTIQEPMRSVLLAVLTDVTANLQGVMQSLVATAGSIVTEQILGVFGTLSNVLGLLVIPAWILTMVADERQIKQRGLGLFAPAIRADVSAFFRVIDRALSTFLRVRLLLAVVTGVLVWAGLEVGSALDIAPFEFAVAAGVLLGALQLIPEIGFFLGFFPMLLILAIGGPIPTITIAIVYILAVRISSALVETRVSRGVLDVHPGLLIPAIVVLSQFGLIWLVAAAPVVAIIRDLVRYANGRLGEPASPAGVLPGERSKRRLAAAATSVARVPSTYRSAAPATTSVRPASLSTTATNRPGTAPLATSQRSTVS